MGAMQEALMDERFTPGAHHCHWTVCFEHRKRLRQCVWVPMDEPPPDTMGVMNTRCDTCLSEESGIDTETLDLFSYADRVDVG